MSSPVFRRTRLVFMAAALAAGSLGASACKHQSAGEHVTRGDAFVTQGKYAEAIIEYRNAVQADGANGAVRLKLGDTYMKVTDGTAALREYVRAADLMPGDVTAQVKAGQLLLLAQSYEDARARADKALAIDGTSLDAQILRGNALAGLKDLSGAITEYEDAIARDPSRTELYANLGTIQFVSGDNDTAEKTFLKAIDTAPKSIQARLALANFYWASRRATDAERVLNAALEIDPKNAEAHRALGMFFLMTGNADAAEPHFKAIAESSDATAPRLTLAQYYVTVKRWDDARAVLTEAAKRPDGFAAATVRLAAIDVAQGHPDVAQQRLAAVLEKQPKDSTALLLKAALLRAARKRTDALAIVNQVIANDPQLAAAHLSAGQIYADLDRVEEAEDQFEQALKLDRRPLQPALELARLHFSLRRLDKALTYAQQAISLEPRSVAAHELIARIYLQTGALDKGRAEIALFQQAFPQSPLGHNLSAIAQLSSRQPQAARAAFERALALDPTNLEALNGVVGIDALTGRSKDSVGRVDAALAKQQPTVDLLTVAARTYATAGLSDRAEQALRQAIELDPERLQAYVLLGQLYAQQHRLDDAVDRFREVVRRNPRSVSAYTMIGMLQEIQGKPSDAEQSYKQVLGIDTHAGVAANNLAYLYVANGRNLDEALQLAQVAKEQLPDEPHVSDTIGWIYVKKQMAASALPHLEASAAKTPDDPVAQYHLGVAYMQTGDFDRAKKSFSRALSLKSDFDGADDARNKLAAIGA